MTPPTYPYVFGLRWEPAPALFGWPGLARRTDLDAACVLLSAEGTVLDAAWVGRLRTRDQAARHAGDCTDGARAGDDETVGVRPELLGPHVAHVLFTVAHADGKGLATARHAVCRLYDLRHGHVAAQLDLTRLGDASTVIAAGLTRTPDGWRPCVHRAMGRGSSHLDLAHLMRRLVRHG